MPTFRVVSQADTTATHRLPRGVGADRAQRALVSTVIAVDLPAVFPLLQYDNTHRNRRIVLVEEVHPGLPVFSDEELTDAFTNPARNMQAEEPLIERDSVDDDEYIYGGGNFIYLANQVAQALRDSGLVPGLHLSLLYGDMSGSVDYSMVEIYDEAQATYYARDSELKHLTNDREATGWDGILALARGIIDAAQPLL